MTAIREHGELRAAASAATSFRQQLWLLGRSGRWIYPIAALSAMLLMLPGGGDPTVAVAGALVGFTGAFWPMIVWYGETPGRRTYHWSLPVARTGHDLMRVAAGAIYLVAISVTVALAAILIDGSVASSFGEFRTVLFLAFVLIPLFPYFLMTALALWSDYTITRWVLAGFVAFPVGATILERAGYGQPADWFGTLFFGGRFSFAFTLFEGIFILSDGRVFPGELWPTAIAIWLAAGILLTLLAASVRPDELKRLFYASKAGDISNGA
ncbi:MAG TPA: hypothetical protein VMN60_00400 [Longimicrobiales bacterium]|nr:hypothetical protein [Longimicrobiales bacterium]